MDVFERLSRDLVAKGKIIDYYQDTIKVPNGNIVKWDFIAHKGAAAIVPVTSEGKILMVRQYRNALDRETLEIPAGGLDSADEPPLVCATRELREETGYTSTEIEHLLTLRTTVAFCNEKIEIYVAHNLQRGERELDEDEYIDLREMSISELEEMIYSGKIEDSKTIAAILAYKNRYVKQDTEHEIS